MDERIVAVDDAHPFLDREFDVLVGDVEDAAIFLAAAADAPL